MKLVLAQINSLVGDIPGNTRKVIAMTAQAVKDFQARIVVFPELALTGYPPEDLLLRPSLHPRIEQALAELCKASGETYIVVGYPRVSTGSVFNAVGVFHRGNRVAEYHKQKLPNYRVFDEKRYFEAGNEAVSFEVDGCVFALSICEDVWFSEPVAQARQSGADILLNISASPFHRGKQQQRESVLAERVGESALPVLYVNAVGGQDELVFDGGSVAVDGQGEVVYRAPAFREGLFPVEVSPKPEGQGFVLTALQASSPVMTGEKAVYEALVLGLREYVDKNGFPGVVLGLSGGIDSALTLAIAVDAIGAARVEAIMMPFRYTSSMSEEDARKQAETLGVSFHRLSIEPIYDVFMETLAPVFGDRAADKTEENIQAR
ncbi:MAG: NAD+ synthase, partial [Pseudomonadales bacterium]|nr:NAD+ synthase [Pseudomonadales bacterium]